MPLGMEVGLGPGDFEFDVDPAPPGKKGTAPIPNFWPMSIVAKRLDESRCLIGTDVNLGQGDVVLDGVAAPPKRGTAPVFGRCLLWPNGWMDEDATWYGSRPRPWPHCVRRVTGTQLSRERGTAAPSFRSMSIVATVAHLSYC